MKVFLALFCLLVVASAVDPVKSNKLPVEAVTALENGTKFILFSLEPPMSIDPPQFTPEMTDDQKLKEVERFRKETNVDPDKGHHGYKILGSTELSDAPSRVSAIGVL